MRQQHKHYYCIRAYADGWNIESKSSVGWEHIPRPFFDEDREYRVVPDEDGWLPWYGGQMSARWNGYGRGKVHA